MREEVSHVRDIADGQTHVIESGSPASAGTAEAQGGGGSGVVGARGASGVSVAAPHGESRCAGQQRCPLRLYLSLARCFCGL